MSSQPLRVAVLGAGTVGREVVRGFLEDPDRLASTDGAPLVLAGVAVRDLDRARRSGIPAELLTDAPAHLVADPRVDVVVELLGGEEPARTLIAAALGAGKPVVTANKLVLARHGADLEQAARRMATPLRFEAAVGGGTPVLGPLAADLATDRIRRIRGVVNGSTNFVLTAMTSGRGYDDVIAEARRLGYLEADPRADVEGQDAVAKLVVLARLAFGSWLQPETIVDRTPALAGEAAPGITGVTAEQMAGATSVGLGLKLVADAVRDQDGTIRAGVTVRLTPRIDPLARVPGAMNRIEVEAEPRGFVAFSGPGAGGPATASAVLADLLAIARGAGSTWAGLAPADPEPIPAAAPSEPRGGWFAFLPDADADTLEEAAPGADAPELLATGVTRAGLALRLAGPLAAARSALGRLQGATSALPLYPVDAE